MRIDVHSHGLMLSADGRRECEGRAAAGLLGLPVERGTVFLSDENGPKGGPDKTCTVRLQLAGGGEVTARRRAGGLLAAVAGAVATAAAAVRRRVVRRRQTGRHGEGKR